MTSATLPRNTSSLFHNKHEGRPFSDFDAGINSSTAWTEHLELEASASEEGAEDEETYRPARALYDFEGKAEFRELNVHAGDSLQVVKQELSDGWSLVKKDDGEIGLLPQDYYTFTLDFSKSPDLHKRQESDSATPRASAVLSPPLVSQTTGDWIFPSFRRSLLGGKSLNRFSSFVTSGAEAWVLNGSPGDSDPTPSTSHHEKVASNASDVSAMEDDRRSSAFNMSEADRHYVDASHIWKTKVPPFRILVHSPSKRASTISGGYTVYNVTSLFSQINAEAELDPGLPPRSPTRITVHRRYSHFVLLHTALTRRLPGIALPPLPEKQYAGRFSEDFVEARRGDLERYLSRVIRHPVARYAEVVTFFLSCESESEWKRLISHHLSTPPAGPAFFAHVLHPAFNVDLDEAEEAATRFTSHTRAVGKGVQGLRNVFGRARDARIAMSGAERLLSYSLLSLITSQPLASAPTTGVAEEDEEYSPKDKGLANNDGAWCWRENCQECLRLTNAMQKTSDALQGVADLYDDHARRRQLITHESLKGVAHPSSLYQGVLNTHRSTTSRYREALSDGHADEDVAARCETVLNTTMAEMETYHTQKNEDFATLTKDHLDGEIEFYEQVLSKLRSARRNFDSPTYQQLGKIPRQPSIYERELENPRLLANPLPQPCPHVFDSAPMRPVSVAIQEGVGMLNLLSPTASRGSVFSRFW